MAKPIPTGVGDQADVGQQVDAGDRRREGGQVAAGAGGQRRQGDDGDELDGGNGPQREPSDRQAKAAVHDGYDRTPAQ
jgi:hypothetical protein